LADEINSAEQKLAGFRIEMFYSSFVRWRTYQEIASGMDRSDQHISPSHLRAFATGEGPLQPHELRHFQDCDECSQSWWRLKQDAERGKTDPKDKSA